MKNSGKVSGKTKARLTAEVNELRTRCKRMESKLNLLMDSIQSTVVEVDLDGVITAINRVQPGLSRGDVVGRSVLDVMDSQNHRQCESVMAEVIETGKTVEFESHNGSSSPGSAGYRQRFVPVIEEGKVVSITIIIDELTQLKQTDEELSQQKEFIEKVFSVMSDTLFIFDPEAGKAVRWNKAFTEVSGYTDDEIAGMKAPDEWYSKGDLVRAAAAMEEISLNGRTAVEMSLITKKGQTVPFEYTASVFSDRHGDPRYVISFGRNMTRHKQVEDNLNHHLEVTEALAQLYKQLVSPDTSIQEIAAAVLEEVRKITGSANGFVSAIDPETLDNVCYSMTAGMDRLFGEEEANGCSRFPVGKDGRYSGIWGHALNTRQGFYTNSPGEYLESTGFIEGDIPFERFLTVPALVGYQLVGQIAVADPGDDYLQRDLEAIRRIGEFYALAIQRLRDREALKDSEKMWHSLVENAPSAISMLDRYGKVLFMNRSLPGLKKEAVVGSIVYDHLPLPRVNILKEVLASVFENGKNLKYESKVSVPGNGGDHYLLNEVAPIKKGEEVTAALFITTDITEQKNSEQALRDRVKELDGIYGLGQMAEQTNSPPELIREFVNVIAPPSMQFPDMVYAEIELDGQTYANRDDECAEYLIAPITVNKKERGYIKIGYIEDLPFIEVFELKLVQGYARRFSEIIRRMEAEEVRRQSEEKLKASLKEKEVLLQEVHHRVKNNMSVISSLLNIQAAVVNDPRLTAIMKEAQNRIRSMAMLHERVYKSKDLASVHLRPYVRDIANYLFRGSDVQSGQIRLDIDVSDVSLGIKKAIPCGLIINELLLNSIKYAFKPGEKGVVSLAIGKSSDTHFQLIVKDDGKGIPPDVQVKQPKTMGLKLVNMMVSQLSGKMEVRSAKGTTFVIRFPFA